MIRQRRRLPFLTPYRHVFIIAALTLCILGSSADAEEFVIGANSPGTAFDALIDGFPGLASMDGIADFGGNRLGIALKTQVTEERALLEFSLDALAGLTAPDIETATLTFNIDDVLTTFGPGTSFDATAAERILLFAYAGNGVIELGDFEEAVGPPFAVVDTSTVGVIADASLTVSGPLFFSVDAHPVLANRLIAGDTHLGIIFVTDDDQTGTSLDDLGNGAGGPPGIGGSILPFLTITTRIVTTTTSTTISTTTTTTMESAMCGDANLNGRITASDALIVLRIAVGVGSCRAQVCDVDANGTISASDALRVLQVAVGLPVELNCVG